MTPSDTMSYVPEYTDSAHVRVTFGYTTTNTSASRGLDDLPLSIPRSQLYFWSREWQAAERQSLAEIARGHGREFSSSVDVIRWLFAPDE